MNKPLTIWGAERRTFFLALVMGGAAFNYFSLRSGLLLFVVLLMLARRTTQRDPQLLRILLNAARFRAAYDPSLYQPAVIEVVRD